MDFLSLSRLAIGHKLSTKVRGLSNSLRPSAAHGQQVYMRRKDWPADFAKHANKIVGHPGNPSKAPTKTTIPRLEGGQLAVCACYFNPAHYKTRIANFHRWYAAAKSQGADIHLIEATMDGEFELPDLPNIKRVKLKSILWHKERLLNVLIKSLPEKYSRVAWVDADLLFDNPDWVTDTYNKLSDFSVCQLFESAYWLDTNDVPIRWWADNMVERQSVAKGYSGGPHITRLHPGFAWAGRRDWLEDVGLWDKHITGTGDAVMALGFLGLDTHLNVFMCGEGINADAGRWAQKIRPYSQDRIGCVPGRVRHLWHGSRQDRGYDGRLLRSKTEGFVPDRDLRVDPETGCYEWSDAAPDSLKDAIRDYFWERKEDG